MLSRRVVQLASLAWSFGIITLVLTSGRMDQRPATDTPLDPLALATTVLRTSNRFSSAAVGYVGTTPDEVLAWRIIFHSSDRDKVFKELLTSGSVSGQLYALAGLWFGDSTEFARAADRLRRNRGTVRTVRGCIVSTEPIADLVGQIEHGNWSREFLTGRLFPTVSP